MHAGSFFVEHPADGVTMKLMKVREWKRLVATQKPSHAAAILSQTTWIRKGSGRIESVSSLFKLGSMIKDDKVKLLD